MHSRNCQNMNTAAINEIIKHSRLYIASVTDEDSFI